MEKTTTTTTTSFSPLLPEEASDAWEHYRSEVEENVPKFITTMGLPPPVSNQGCEHIGRPPTKREVKLALRDDSKLHEKIMERIEREFHNAVNQGRVDREKIAGFLNRVTHRTARKLATQKARPLLATLMPYVDINELLANVADLGMSPEELLANREVLRRYGHVVARLPARDLELLDAKFTMGGYDSLAEKRRSTAGAVKTKACRLWETVCRQILGVDYGLWRKVQAGASPTRKSQPLDIIRET